MRLRNPTDKHTYQNPENNPLFLYIHLKGGDLLFQVDDVRHPSNY